jgi:hypothetical protein
VDTTGAVVMVTELKCTDVGCPPFDTGGRYTTVLALLCACVAEQGAHP